MKKLILPGLVLIAIGIGSAVAVFLALADREVSPEITPTPITTSVITPTLTPVVTPVETPDGSPSQEPTQVGTPTPDATPAATPTGTPDSTPVVVTPTGTPIVLATATATSTPIPLEGYPYGGIVEVSGNKLEVLYNYTAELTSNSFSCEVNLKITNLSQVTVPEKDEQIFFLITFKDGDDKVIAEELGTAPSYKIKPGETSYRSVKRSYNNEHYSEFTPPVKVEVKTAKDLYGNTE